jgi:uncharacterized protein (DUF488 family)
MTSALKDIFTVGHSNHTTTRFIELLKAHCISLVADVRSSPRTRVNPDFGRPEIERILRKVGIEYVFLGEELGARSQDETCYENGKVRYDRLARQTLFQDGLDRIEMDSERFRVSLLCAEREPLDCHRCILVARHLVKRNLPVSHILSDGIAETHAATMLRLRESLGLLKQHDLFRNDDDLTETAYRLQEQKIAYKIPEEKTLYPVA